MARRTIKVYDSYSFIEKDPIIDQMRTAWEDSGHTYVWCAKVSGLSSGTISNWFGGKTKRPQNAACCAFMGALGFEHRWVKTSEARVLAEKIARKKKLTRPRRTPPIRLQ